MNSNEQETVRVRPSVAGQFVTTLKLIAIMGALGLGLWLIDKWLVG